MLLFELFQQNIMEVPMTPTAFAQSWSSGADSGMRVGFEFEVCVPQAVIRRVQAEKKKAQAKEKFLFTFPPDWADEFNGQVIELADIFRLRQPMKWNNESYTSLYKLIVDWQKFHIDRFYANWYKKALDTAPRRLRNVLKDIESSPKNERAQEFLYDVVPGFPGSQITREAAKVDETVNNASQFLKQVLNIDPAYTPEPVLVFKSPSAAERFKEFVGYDSADEDDDDFDHGEDYDYEGAVDVLAPALESRFGPVTVFTEYHETGKKMDRWYIEPDGSLEPNGNDGAAEVVSPPMPINDGLQAYRDFVAIAQKLKCYTSRSARTGLHINLSLPKQIDLLKLAVILGDEYVLKSFGREDYHYAQSFIKAMSNPDYDEGDFDYLPNMDTFDIGNPKSLARLNQLTKRNLGSHFSSITYNKKGNNEYISFRQVGFDYLNQSDRVINTLERFVHALVIAADPQAYRNDYLKKLAKLVGTTQRITKTRQGREKLEYHKKFNLGVTGIPVIYVVTAGRTRQGTELVVSKYPVRDRREYAVRGLRASSNMIEIKDPTIIQSVVRGSRLKQQLKKEILSSPGTRLIVVIPFNFQTLDTFEQQLKSEFPTGKSVDTAVTNYVMIRQASLVKKFSPLFAKIIEEMEDCS